LRNLVVKFQAALRKWMGGGWGSICTFLVEIETAVFVLAFVAWAKSYPHAPVTLIRLLWILQQKTVLAMTRMFDLG
jgi:hypothetical protein